MFRTESSPIFSAAGPEVPVESSVPAAVPKDESVSEVAAAPLAETSPALAGGVEEKLGEASSVEGHGTQGNRVSIAEPRKSNNEQGAPLRNDTETSAQEVAPHSTRDMLPPKNEANRPQHPQNSHDGAQAAGRAPQSMGRGGQQKNKGGQQKNKGGQQARNEAANSRNRGAGVAIHSRDEDDAPLKAGTLNFPAMVTETQLRPSKTLR